MNKTNKNKKIMKGKVFFGVLFLFAIALAMPINAYTIDGDRVYIDNEHVYISITPHTVNGPTWIETELRTVAYTGNVDFTFGFNGSNAWPSNLQLWQKDGCFNEETGLTEDCYVHWDPEVGVLDYNYDNNDRWYYVLNNPIVAEQTYKIRFWLDVKPYTSGKYGFAIKPSGYTMQQAIDLGYFYYLDPWYESDACGTLSEANSVYELNQSVNSSGTCYSITANNITIDGKGYFINFSQSGGNNEYGIYATGVSNLTIRNITIFADALSTNTSRHGIYFNNVNNSLIEYVNATAGDNSYGGIYLYSSSNYNTLTSNTGNAGTYSGIDLSSSSNYNTLTSNTGNATENWDYHSSNSLNNTFYSSIYKDNFYLSNSTVFVYNLTNALIFNSSKNVYANTTLSYNDENINITFLDTGYLFDNYKLNESETRTNNPISITGTSTSKTITSTLVDTINVDIIAEAGTLAHEKCDRISSITYQGTTWSAEDARNQCSNEIITLTSQSVSTGASTLTIAYGSLGNICDSTGSGIYEFLQLVPVIIIVFLALFGIMLLMAYNGQMGLNQLDLMVLVKGGIGIIISLIILSIGASIVYEMTC